MRNFWEYQKSKQSYESSKLLLQNIQWKIDFDQYIIFSIVMQPTLKLVLLVLLTQTLCARDPFITLVAYQKSQRASSGLGDSQYHLLPFRVSGTSQHFIQNPQVNQFLNVEVTVHWLNNNSQLSFPQFDLSQKVRLVIEEESMGTNPKKAILTKEFLTQTGFKLQLEAGRRYRWKIDSSGVSSKLVQIAMVNKPKNATLSAVEIKEQHQQEVEVLREMSKTLEKAKQARAYRESKLKESEVAKVADMWAWMSGMEMVSLLGFLLVQLALFQKFMLPTSVV